MTPNVSRLSVPSTLDEAHTTLLLLLSPKQVEELRVGGPEAVLRHHHELGRLIRNEWLRHGSLGRVFVGVQAGSLDEMSALILDSLARKIRGGPTDFPAA